MSRFRYRMTGQKRVSAVFRHLREVPVHAGLRTGIESGARLVRDRARRKARRSRIPKNRYGHAADHITSEILRDEKGRGLVVAAIGPHKKKGWYLRFWETGFRNVPAQPFLRPSIDEGQDEVIDRVGKSYWDNLNRVAAALGVVTRR